MGGGEGQDIIRVPSAFLLDMYKCVSPSDHSFIVLIKRFSNQFDQLNVESIPFHRSGILVIMPY